MFWIPSHLSKGQKEERRLRAKERLREGKLSQSEIARELGVDRSAVSRWAKVLAEDEDGLKAKAHGGRPRQIKPAQEQQLLSDLSLGAKRWGYASERWSSVRVAEVLKRSQGIDYHPDHVRKILRRLDWSPQKAEKQAMERDEARIQRWLREDYPKSRQRGRR